jgi:hypothetical protein
MGKFEIQIQNKDMFHIMCNATKKTKEMQKFLKKCPIDDILDLDSDASMNRRPQKKG